MSSFCVVLLGGVRKPTLPGKGSQIDTCTPAFVAHVCVMWYCAALSRQAHRKQAKVQCALTICPPPDAPRQLPREIQIAERLGHDRINGSVQTFVSSAQTIIPATSSTCTPLIHCAFSEFSAKA